LSRSEDSELIKPLRCLKDAFYRVLLFRSLLVQFRDHGQIVFIELLQGSVSLLLFGLLLEAGLVGEEVDVGEVVLLDVVVPRQVVLVPIPRRMSLLSVYPSRISLYSFFPLN
jgi:hypothetical protein